jgi:hypothetical protein
MASVIAMGIRAPAPTPAAVRISARAAARYRQRVRPALDLQCARRELEQLRLQGQISKAEPRWMEATRPAPYHLVFADVLALPLVPHAESWFATTCVSHCWQAARIVTGTMLINARTATERAQNVPANGSASRRREAPSTPPAIPGALHSTETLQMLAQHLDSSRRHRLAETRLHEALVALPRDRWLVERNAHIHGRNIPFLLLGETGVFVLWAVAGPPQWSDAPHLAATAHAVKELLPGYAGAVHAGMCRPLKPALKPRQWYAIEPGSPKARDGCWVMGVDWVIRWLAHFGHDHGLGVEDLRRFDALAGPHWGRAAGPDIPPCIPDLD